MTIRNIIAIGLILLSLALLYPGLTLPMLNIYVGAKVPMLGEIELYDQTQSIVQAIRALFDSKHHLVAALILLFSVLVPIIKALLLLVVLAFERLPWRGHLYRAVAIIGKWSMADVFVVSIFMAYLSGQANSFITASLFDGFYYFTAYCVVSIIGIALIELE